MCKEIPDVSKLEYTIRPPALIEIGLTVFEKKTAYKIRFNILNNNPPNRVFLGGGGGDR